MDNDIVGILYRIKENIKLIEGGDATESLLDEVRADFLDLIELIKLFLISERDSYYGYFLMNMQFRANFQANCIAGIKLNEFPPVFESNPLLLCKFTLKEIIYIVCHEIDHVVLNHPAEMVKANPTQDPNRFYEFNLAADAAVNDRLDHEIVAEKHNFMSSPDGLITSKVLAEMFNLRNVQFMENYAYYFALIAGKAEKQEANQPQQNGSESMMQEKMESESSGDGKGKGSNSGDGKRKSSREADKQESASSEGEDQDTASGEGDDSSSDGKDEKTEETNSGSGSSGDGEENNKKVVTAKNFGGKLSDHDWEAGNDPEDATAAARELVNASVGMMNEESRGLMPGYFMSEVQKINKPPVLSWQAILKKYVGTITANKRKTRTRLNRRQPERFDLSGTMDDKILKIVVAIDTSGSVSDHMISMIFNEIFAILAKRKHEITIIECDAQVRRVYKARNVSEVKKKVAGRGGTWFSPVIDYINNDRYFRDALLIYFTDGYGEREIPKPRTYRNMWVVIGGAENLSLKEPYGVVLSL